MSETTTQTRETTHTDSEDDMSNDATQIQTTDDKSQMSGRDRYAPQNFSELMTFAKVVVESNLCPSHISRPEDAVMIVQQGTELGLSPMQALQNMHAIKGKVGLGADLMKALCQQSGEVAEWRYEERTDQRCELHVQREDREPLPAIIWTVQDAKDKGLMGSNVWQKYTRQMLQHRADAEASRAAFPDLLAGLYSKEELQSIPDRDGNGQSRQPRPSPPADADVTEAEVVDDGPDVAAQKRRIFGALSDVGCEDGRIVEYVESRLGDREGVEVFDDLNPDEAKQLADEVSNLSPEPSSGRPSPRRVHVTCTALSARDFAGKPDHSSGNNWQSASDRFHAVVGAVGDDELVDAVREGLKARHHVDSWKQIPHGTIDKWADLLEAHNMQTEGGGSPRYEFASKLAGDDEQDDAA